MGPEEMEVVMGELGSESTQRHNKSSKMSVWIPCSEYVIKIYFNVTWKYIRSLCFDCVQSSTQTTSWQQEQHYRQTWDNRSTTDQHFWNICVNHAADTVFKFTSLYILTSSSLYKICKHLENIWLLSFFLTTSKLNRLELFESQYCDVSLNIWKSHRRISELGLWHLKFQSSASFVNRAKWNTILSTTLK